MDVEKRKPVEGITYTPGPDVVPVSDGLPRTVTEISTRPGLDVFVVHYRTDEGRGFASDNVWDRWIRETGAVAS